MSVSMSKNARLTIIVAIAAALVLAVALLVTNVLFKRGETIDCGNDDIRRTIDLRDFTTRYWAYSIEFEASIVDKGKLASKLEPKQLQQLSEAMQQGREFRQFVVAGYNACAISKAQYGDYGAKFQALDGIARQIDKFISQDAGDKTRLEELVRQYISLSQGLAAP